MPSSADSALKPVDGAAAQVKFDDIDRGMIRLLRRDGRMTTSEMAKQLNIAEPTARRRLRRLLSKEGGVRISAILDPKIAAARGTLFLVRMKIEPAHLRQICETICSWPEAANVSLLDGPYNLQMSGVFESRESFVEFMNTHLSTLEGISDFEIVSNIKLLKLGQHWVAEYMEYIDNVLATS